MKKITVLGGGESGVGAAVLAKKKGFDVWLSDIGQIKNKYKKVLLHNDIEFEEGKHTQCKILDADEIVKSPGIPDEIDILKTAKQKNINVVSEIELAARYTKGKLIGITGTNGKTTTAKLTHHIFKQAGLDVCLAGNVGVSFAQSLSERDYDYFVLELSSFQLEYMFKTRLHTALILNISEDHLDRYDNSMKRYVDAKFRVLQNQTADDAFIYWADDNILSSEVTKRSICAQLFPYSVVNKVKNGGYIKNNKMYIKYNSDSFDSLVNDFSLKGRHNDLNAMASAVIALRNNIRKEKIKECLCNFSNVEHRLEYVCKIRSVEYYNDSKATNVNAAWYALESFQNPIIWIAGGVEKGNDYTRLKPLVNEKVKAIICLGLDNSNIIASFQSDVEKIIETKSMADAVASAYELAAPNDVVLLSPACSSFDLFENFEDRGTQFKNAVLNL